MIPAGALLIFGIGFLLGVLVIGIIKPMFPALVFLWLIIGAHILASDHVSLPKDFFVWTAVAIVILYFLEYVQTRGTMREFRMTFLGVAGGVVGGFVGMFFSVVQGLTLGPLLGVIVGQLLAGRDVFFSIQTSSTRILGYIGLTILKLALGFLLIGSWAMAVAER